MYGMRNSIGIGVSGNIALTIAAMFTGGGGGTNVAFDLMKTLGGLVYFPGIGTVDSIPTGNYTDASGTVVSSVNGPVGLVKDATGTAWTGYQSVFANQPTLQLLSGKYLWNFAVPATATMPFGASTTWTTATVITITATGVILTQNRALASSPIVITPGNVIYGIFVLPTSPTQSQLQLLMDYANGVSPVVAAALVIMQATASRLWLPGDALSSNGLPCLNYSDAGATVPAVQGGSVLVVKDALGSTDNAVGQLLDATYTVFKPTLSKSLGKDCIRHGWVGVQGNNFGNGFSKITFQNTLTGTGTILTASNGGVNNYTNNIGGYNDTDTLYGPSTHTRPDFSVFFGALLITPVPSAGNLATLTAYLTSLIPTVGADPYRNNVSLLCHMNDTLNAVHPTTIADSGPLNITGVVAGTNIVGSTAANTYRFGISCIDAPVYITAADYVQFSSMGPFDFGTGDFTIEFCSALFNFNAGTGVLMGVWNTTASASWKIVVSTARSLQFWANGALVLETRQYIYDGTNFAPYHYSGYYRTHAIAFVRSAGILSIYVEGYLMASTPFATAIVPAVSTSLLLFRDYQGIDVCKGGNLNELRITKGVARYTAPYTPSDFPFPNN